MKNEGVFFGLKAKNVEMFTLVQTNEKKKATTTHKYFHTDGRVSQIEISRL